MPKVFEDIINRIQQTVGKFREGASEAVSQFTQPKMKSPIPENQMIDSPNYVPPVRQQAQAPLSGTEGYPSPEDIAQRVRDFYASKAPKGVNIDEYYPVGPELDEIVARGEQARPGAGALLALQSFFESTGGRNTPNLFGVKPKGQSGKGKFNSTDEAVDYQMGKDVLAGGANPNMNILNEGTTEPLTAERIRQLYSSYDPPGAYLDSMLDAFMEVTSPVKNNSVRK